MQLSPRYGTAPALRLDGDPAAIAAPMIAQRRRLLEIVSAFDSGQWAHRSRCADWSNRDVIHHLVSTNGFWEFSITSGLQGSPTTMLSNFDPAASPSALIDAAGEVSDQQVLDEFATSVASLDALVGGIDDAGWTAVAESPPGHVSVSAVAHHALWDSWIHERDIMLPLGLEPTEEVDEAAACLRYVAGLNPSFQVGRVAGRRGSFSIRTTDPSIEAVVEIDDDVLVRSGRNDGGVVLAGSSIELTEALSRRVPLQAPIPEHDGWMFQGLAVVFDQC